MDCRIRSGNDELIVAIAKRDASQMSQLNSSPNLSANALRAPTAGAELGAAKSPAIKGNEVDRRHVRPRSCDLCGCRRRFGAGRVAGCLGEGAPALPEKATRELPAALLSLLAQKKMPKLSPILLRIFKEESELEVWKQTATGRFELLKIYPICRWSGELGPKLHEGDYQAPEGFYAITPKLMNPNSSYYLAINMGFPNAFDAANGRDGSFLMIHGNCASVGCYAMTDEQIGEIYALARNSFLGGKPAFQVQAYPFRMTPENLARHRTNPNMPFWQMLKIGNDHFEATHLEPKVDVCDRRYVFDARPLPGSSTSGLSKALRSARRINVPPSPSTRRSRSRRSRNNAPMKPRMRNWSKTTCRLSRSTPD